MHRSQPQVYQNDAQMHNSVGCMALWAYRLFDCTGIHKFIIFYLNIGVKRVQATYMPVKAIIMNKYMLTNETRLLYNREKIKWQLYKQWECKITSSTL